MNKLETTQQLMDRLAQEATCKHGVNLHVMSCGMCVSNSIACPPTCGHPDPKIRYCPKLNANQIPN